MNKFKLIFVFYIAITHTHKRDFIEKKTCPRFHVGVSGVNIQSNGDSVPYAKKKKKKVELTSPGPFIPRFGGVFADLLLERKRK